MAKVIPGKEDYAETIRYYNRQIELTGVHLYLNTKASAEMLLKGGFDEIILATGVTPRRVSFEGANHPKVLDYADVLYRNKPVGKRVAVVGAGGIGFDMAEFLSHDHDAVSPSLNTEKYMEEWGVDMAYSAGGSLAAAPRPAPSPREIYLLKRSGGKHGKTLGKTTGWIHKASLAMKQVKMLANVEYQKVDNDGLHISINGGRTEVLPVDNVVVYAGQEPLRDLFEKLKAEGQTVHLIGGAKEATELDAKRAIKEASYLAAKI